MKLLSVTLVLSLMLTACSTIPTSHHMDAANLGSAGVSRLAKSDIDEVVELHQQAVMQDLKTFMIKLYKRNPNQRFDKNKRSLKESVDLVFERPYTYGYSHWEDMAGTDIVRLALDADYHVNDRVLTLIVGLRKMLMASYNNHTEFFYVTSIDEQKLYNSARNIEIAAWLLAEKRDKKGRLLMLSDSTEKENRNLSFQRLIGRMIATQDNLATIVSYKSGRLIKTVVVKAASMAFLPI